MSENWYKLDNAAITVPCSAHGADTRVFRIAAELTEPVDPDLLQEALDETAPEFPHYNTALRKGLFWYYLDKISEQPTVRPETDPALRPLYFPGRRTLLYRILYYGNRVSLEMFHVLADGTGGFLFFRKILIRYLAKKYDVIIGESELETSSAGDKSDDAFSRYYQKMPSSAQLQDMTMRKAFQIHGERDENQQSHLVEGIVPARKVIDLAHQYETSVGVFTTSLFIAAVVDTMSVRDRRNPVVVSVPVNLRQFFPSETARNFFGVINISYDARSYDGTIESVIPEVNQSFKTQLRPEIVAETMNSYSKLVQNLIIRVVPLFVKEPVLTGAIYLANRGVTATLSNLGQIKMPSEVENYVDHFAAFMAAPSLQITMASYHGKMVFGTAGGYASHDVMMRFYRLLTRMGVDAEIATNDYDRENEAR